MITSNFLVDESGAYRDLHAAMIFLPGEAAPEPGAGPPRMRVRDVMNEKAFPVTAGVTMEYLADLMALTEFSEQMVIDHGGKFVGVVSEADLLRALIPDVEEIVKEGGTLNDAMRIFFQLGEDLAPQPIARLVKSHPRTVSPTNGEFLAVATVMLVATTGACRSSRRARSWARCRSPTSAGRCCRWNGLNQQ